MAEGGHIEVKGGAELAEKLRELARKYPEAGRNALTKEALALLAEAVKLTPVDTGRLPASAYATPTGPDGKARVGYGAEYAVAVHEKIEAHHPVGQAKFLETPFNAVKGELPKRIAERIKEEVE